MRIIKKEKIIEKARELFTIYGYKKVSMDEIAQEAEVTKKTIYSYFKDKEELFNYFVLEEISEMKKIIETNEEKNIAFFDQVHQTIYELLEYRKNAKFIVKIAKESENLKNKSVIQSLKMVDNSIQEYIKNKINYAMKNKYIKTCDCEITSFLIYKMYVALMYEWEQSEPLDIKQISDHIMTILKDGIFEEKAKKGTCSNNEKNY